MRQTSRSRPGGCFIQNIRATSFYDVSNLKCCPPLSPSFAAASARAIFPLRSTLLIHRSFVHPYRRRDFRCIKALRRLRIPRQREVERNARARGYSLIREGGKYGIIRSRIWLRRLFFRFGCVRTHFTRPAGCISRPGNIPHGFACTADNGSICFALIKRAAEMDGNWLCRMRTSSPPPLPLPSLAYKYDFVVWACAGSGVPR